MWAVAEQAWGAGEAWAPRCTAGRVGGSFWGERPTCPGVLGPCPTPPHNVPCVRSTPTKLGAPDAAGGTRSQAASGQCVQAGAQPSPPPTSNIHLVFLSGASVPGSADSPPPPQPPAPPPPPSVPEFGGPGASHEGATQCSCLVTGGRPRAWCPRGAPRCRRCQAVRPSIGGIVPFRWSGRRRWVTDIGWPHRGASCAAPLWTRVPTWVSGAPWLPVLGGGPGGGIPRRAAVLCLVSRGSPDGCAPWLPPLAFPPVAVLTPARPGHTAGAQISAGPEGVGALEGFWLGLIYAAPQGAALGLGGHLAVVLLSLPMCCAGHQVPRGSVGIVHLLSSGCRTGGPLAGRHPAGKPEGPPLSPPGWQRPGNVHTAAGDAGAALGCGGRGWGLQGSRMKAGTTVQEESRCGGGGGAEEPEVFVCSGPTRVCRGAF